MSQAASSSSASCSTSAGCSSPQSASTFDVRELATEIDRALEGQPSWELICEKVRAALPRFLANEGAIPATHLVGNPERYTRNLLYADPAKRYVVLALVWEAGQQTPIHDHECWGVVGCYRGAITEVAYATPPPNVLPVLPNSLKQTTVSVLSPGQSCAVDPPNRDLHRMKNDTGARTVTVHVYGREMLSCNVFCNGAITRRHFVYDQTTPVWSKS
ncbi:MAG: cysteine dioxygenase family protein [Planctomycetes bacterium]|nr:cysteine dioxygenase family protein [Planctomycetota bacterium]